MKFGRFFVVALAVTLPPYAYLAFALGASSAAARILLALPFASILSLPLFVFGLDRARDIWWRDVMIHVAHFSMGLTTYLAVFTLARDLLRASGVVDPPVWVVFAATGAALLTGLLVAVRGPRIKRVRVKIEDLDPRLDGFRIVQISDLHVSPSIGHRYVSRVVRLTNALKPDLVALTGDIADGDVTRLRASARALGDLAPKDRVFYVPGNHEYYWNLNDWLVEFRRLGCHVLLNTGVAVGDLIWVGGVTDPQAASFGEAKPDVKEALAGGEDRAFKLLLSHRPDFARAAAELGFDLQLSGHTHGGQFFPWTVVIAFVHEFYLGLKKVGRGWIYVSPGTGTWGPMLRLGTTPELTELTLVR